jgi:hypothetical protein
MIFCARAMCGLRRMRRERPSALLARRTRTIKLCSFDARNGDHISRLATYGGRVVLILSLACLARHGPWPSGGGRNGDQYLVRSLLAC